MHFSQGWKKYFWRCPEVSRFEVHVCRPVHCMQIPKCGNSAVLQKNAHNDTTLIKAEVFREMSLKASSHCQGSWLHKALSLF